MEQANLYIKRLLLFVVCVFAYIITEPLFELYVSIPVLLLAFSIIHSRITGEKPPHLFAFYRTDEFFKKGGLRDLIRIFVTLFGFIYDTIIWLVWSVYLIFMLFVDLLDFLKFIFFWIIHAILWFLRLYAPFIVLLYKIFIHYIVRWSWWLYQIAYFNIRYAYNKNCYRIALIGTVLASAVIFIFYYIEILLVTIPGVFVIGYIIALLPITWSFGEIATLRLQKTENEDYLKIKLKFQNGIEAVRSILFYITLFVVLLLIQLGLNLFGWIPKSGVVIAGFMFNIDTFISLILGFICTLIVFGVMILPSYRLYTTFSELRLTDTVDLLKTIGRKILQYLFITVPNAILIPIVIAIPFIVVLIFGILTYNIKNGIANIKIDQLKTEQASTNNEIEAYKLSKKVDHLEKLKQFPLYLSQEIEHRRILATEIALSREDYRSQNEEALNTSEQYKSEIGAVQKEIVNISQRYPNSIKVKDLQLKKSQLQAEMTQHRLHAEKELVKMKIDIEHLEQRRNQIPFLFFFGGLWLVLFGSIVLAFATAFLGNVFHQLYVFRNDSSSSEWQKTVTNIRMKDTKQPLLGGTLFIITLIIVWLLLALNNAADILSQIFTVSA